MKNLLHIGILILCIIFSSPIFSQSISLSVDSVPTVCYNDGMLIMHASGGVSPYQFSIISGPVAPNLAYPIILPWGRDTFLDMTHGTFSIVVKDATYHTDTFTAHVGGTYTFPTFTFVHVTGGIVCTPSGGLGPYSYAVSRTGSNSNFSSYQSSSMVRLCEGPNWVRLKDSCGNIYTQPVNLPDSLSFRIICENYSKGIAELSASHGVPPYTYYIGNQVSHTGTFTNLSPGFENRLITVSDSCGYPVYGHFHYPFIKIVSPCPPDGHYYLDMYSDPDTFQFYCANCVPVQTVTVIATTPYTSRQLFYNIVPDSSYHIIVTRLAGSCGVDTMRFGIEKAQPGLLAQFTNCRDFIAAVAPATAVDSYVVYSPHHIPIAINHTGIFTHMPDSAVTVTAYMGRFCGVTSVSSTIVVPDSIPVLCYDQVFDSTCTRSLQMSIFTDFSDSLTTLLDPLGNVVPPVSPGYYENIAPNTPYRVSTGECTTPIFTIDSQLYTPYVSYSCIDLSIRGIMIHGQTTDCNAPALYVKLYQGQTEVSDVILYPDSLENYGPIPIVDTGLYTFNLYELQSYSPSDPNPIHHTWDTICPHYMGSIEVTDYQPPYPFPPFAYLCNIYPGQPIFYQIVGGAPPFTVEITGFPNATVYGGEAAFPTDTPGSYTMITYDNCGISRSFSYNVVDTCNCNIGAVIDRSVSSQLLCAGATLNLTSRSTGVISANRWYINDSLYSVSADTTFTPIQGGQYTIKLKVTGFGPCGSDSSVVTLPIDTVPGFMGFPYDTLLCASQGITLSTGYTNTYWSTGQIDSSIYVSQPGYYFAYISNGCGYFPFSTIVNAFSPTLLGSDQTFCNQPVFAYLSTGYNNTVWSTGNTGPYIFVSSPGTYSATYSNHCGTFFESVNFNEEVPVSLGQDTTYCSQPFSQVLRTGYYNTVWSTGSYGSNIIVTAPGTYTATYTEHLCTFTDSIHIDLVQPADIGSDTTYCDHNFSRTLSTGYANTNWSTGDIGPYIFVSTPGRYIATYSNQCGVFADSIMLNLALPVGLGNDTSYCSNTFSQLLITGYANTYWSTGATAPSITVSAPGTYTATYTEQACTFTDSINIGIVQPADLGVDVTYCNNNFFRTLSTGYANTTWSTGEIGPSITVSAPGLYIAVYFDQCGVFSDSIRIDLIVPVSLGADTTYCGDAFSRVLTTDYTNTNWSTGATGSSITVSSPGTYTANYSNQCGFFSDSIRLSLVQPIDLGRDTSYCTDTFSQVLTTGYANTSWSNGATGPSIAVSAPGTYTATYTNQCGVFSDTIILSRIQPAYLGSDTTYCDNTFSRVLTTGYANTSWSTGATGAAITVSAPGTYTATYSDQCGVFVDSIHLVSNYVGAVYIADSLPTITFCRGIPDTILLEAWIDSLASAPVSFEWSTGHQDMQAYSSGIKVFAGGTYQVVASKGLCSIPKEIMIDTAFCDTPCTYKMAIPTAFTPNGDGKNECFHLLFACPVYSFTLSIMDRWGETVYHSTDYSSCWDGTLKGVPLPQESYIWFCCIQEKSGSPTICQSGKVVLIR